MYEQLFYHVITILRKKGTFVDLGFGICVVTPNLSANHVFQSVDVIPVSSKMSHIKVVEPLVSRNNQGIILKLAPFLYSERGLLRKLRTRKIGSGILNEIKDLGLSFFGS